MSALPPALVQLADEIRIAATGSGVMIAVAESCTGGLIASCLTENPGGSICFDRGFVTYSYASKEDMLGVDHDLLHAEGAVSQAVAEAMARGALERSAASITVSVTGVAGPGQTESKPEGLVWFGVATRSGVKTVKREFGAIGRANVRLETVRFALELLRDALRDDIV